MHTHARTRTRTHTQTHTHTPGDDGEPQLVPQVDTEVSAVGRLEHADVVGGGRDEDGPHHQYERARLPLQRNLQGKLGLCGRVCACVRVRTRCVCACVRVRTRGCDGCSAALSLSLSPPSSLSLTLSLTCCVSNRG